MARIRACDVHAGMRVKHCLFEHYGVGVIREVKEGVVGVSGKQLLCDFPCGPTLWLSVQEVKNARHERAERMGVR